ncbi:PEP-CTERM sorting domain-containing protein, partial [Acinetobacter baumannii]
GSYASPVPEEPTALMLVAGLGVLSVMVWRRRIPALD